MRRSSAARSSALGMVVGLPAVALLLAACGGGSGAPSGSVGYGAPAGGSGNEASGMVSVQQVASFGPLLEDSKGNTVYYDDQETGNTFKCTQTCLGFWYPVPASANPGNVAGLGTVQRSDNQQQQLTYQGRPLYTFQLDTAPGQRNGDNLSDDFAGTHFTWHAATTGPVTNPAPPKTVTNNGIVPVGPGGGAPSPTTDNSYGGGGYGGY